MPDLDHAAAAPAEATTLAVGVHAGPVVDPAAPADLDLDFLRARGFRGRLGETSVLMADDGTALMAVGLGEAGATTADDLRKAAAAAVRASWEDRHLAIALLSAAPGVRPAQAAQALAEGALLAAYRFTAYKSDPKGCRLERITLVGGPRGPVGQGLERGRSIARAVCLARDLGNEPAGALTPARLAEVATEVAGEAGLSIEVWDEARCRQERLGGLLGVAAGSAEPPRLIRLAYEPRGRARATVALVGKGITFDSGGLSIKTADGMATMKTDMSGAAAVLGAMAALPAVGPPVRVLGYLCCTENMPGGTAMKPGDVLRARNGKTIEVLNTDAEGRLVLADGLSLAVEEGVDAIVDLATLTGAVSTALGRQIAGLLGTHQGLVDQVREAADRAGELVWQLPLHADYRKHLDSEVADLKNTGTPSPAGTIMAGLFLKEFVGDVPWAHLDIAGTARSDADDGPIPKGSTGFGVRLLVELLAGFRKPGK